MTLTGKAYNFFQQASAITMIVALLWLTISAPFVFAAQQDVAKQQKTEQNAGPITGNEEEAANPFGSSEKKASAGSSFSEEYLHDNCNYPNLFLTGLRYHKSENAGTYTAFHGELLVPPPNAA